MSGPDRREAGSATIWVLAVSVLLLLVGAMATVRGAAVLARHRAESAADVAALAAAGRLGTGTAPCAAAGEVARRNAASVVACRVRADPAGRAGVVDVVVAVPVRLPGLGRTVVRASARAGRIVGPGAHAIAGARSGATGFGVNALWHAGSRRPAAGAPSPKTTVRRRAGG